MQASLCFDWNEEILQEFETEADDLARGMSELRVSKVPTEVVDDRSPASQLPPLSSKPSATASRRRDEVVLEDYFPVDNDWHTPPGTFTREEKVKSVDTPYYPPTPDTIKTRKTPTGPSTESPAPAPPPSSKSGEVPLKSTPAPAARTLKQLKKKTPVGFRPLVEVLYNLREEGYDRPLRSSVGLHLIQMDPQVYQRAGYTRFAQYAFMAVTLGIVELGGRDGKAWISFHPTFETV